LTPLSESLMNSLQSNTLEEYAESGSISSIENHLHKWIAVLKDYRLKTKEEPWGYLERTQIGFFAAACWLLGIPAREEWRTKKGEGSNESGGRCDLWIHEPEFFIEAKHLYCVLSDAGKPNISNVQTFVTRAKADASRLQCQPDQKLAFTFIAPLIPQSNQDNIDQRMSEWLDAVSRLEHHALAWYLPGRRETRRFSYLNHCPGVVLLIHRP